MVSTAMELLRSNLSRVRIPEPTNRIYKHECCVSFDTLRSEGGLFIDMNSFLAFGKEFANWNYDKTGNPVYLHIKETKKHVPEDRPTKKPTLLAIGGSNHAVEYFKETGYPLSVKLGTITADLEGADVFSYPEDEGVEDPLLAQHPAFFGIDFTSLQKTEMTTAEREVNQNTNFDWNRIQESGEEVKPLFGPGYTALFNLGNSCYMAATMQVIFSTQSFFQARNLPMGYCPVNIPSQSRRLVIRTLQTNLSKKEFDHECLLYVR